MNKDLTVGKPSTVLWKFCLPMFGSVVFQQLYNIADSLVAGKFVGEAALAAVGNSYEITLIFIAFAFGCNIGCSVIVSRFFGAKQYRDMKTAVSTALIGCAALVALLMLAGLFGCDALLELINTPAEILADSALYLDIYVLGLPFMFFYNVATGIFSALGDSKTPFFFLAASSVSNIFMDILFVTAFDMGVAGVAWATFLCQGVSCVLAVWAVARRMQAIPTAEKPALFSWRMLGKIAVIAVPSILQQSSVSVGNIVIQSVINSFGASVIAGYSAAVKLNNLVITSFTTLANGISNYTSQNLGAAKPERVRQGYAAGVKLVWLICVPLAAAYFFARKIRQVLGVPVGISDHTLSSTVALTSVALGARIVEKHFILNRGIGGPDAAFSMEADEFRRMVATIRDVEKALGRVTYDLSPAVRRNRKFARSLFVVENLRAGDILTDKNVRSIRPADGLAPKYLPQVLGHRVNRDIERGEPLKMEYID